MRATVRIKSHGTNPIQSDRLSPLSSSPSTWPRWTEFGTVRAFAGLRRVSAGRWAVYSVRACCLSKERGGTGWNTSHTGPGRRRQWRLGAGPKRGKSEHHGGHKERAGRTDHRLRYFPSTFGGAVFCVRRPVASRVRTPGQRRGACTAGGAIALPSFCRSAKTHCT